MDGIMIYIQDYSNSPDNPLEYSGIAYSPFLLLILET